MRPECSKDENIVRAIRISDWDETQNWYSSSLFRGQYISVSRLKILPLSELFTIFHMDLDRPPQDEVVGAGEINAGNLISIGRESNVELTVEEDPLELTEAHVANPAHAEIPQRISRALAKKIIKRLMIHREHNQ